MDIRSLFPLWSSSTKVVAALVLWLCSHDESYLTQPLVGMILVQQKSCSSIPHLDSCPLSLTHATKRLPRWKQERVRTMYAHFWTECTRTSSGATQHCYNLQCLKVNTQGYLVDNEPCNVLCHRVLWPSGAPNQMERSLQITPTLPGGEFTVQGLIRE